MWQTALRVEKPSGDDGLEHWISAHVAELEAVAPES
jgi:hypothetical protein